MPFRIVLPLPALRAAPAHGGGRRCRACLPGLRSSLGSCSAATSSGLTSGKASARLAAHTSSQHWLRARLADAKVGWIAISMKNDWKVIFPFENK